MLSKPGNKKVLIGFSGGVDSTASCVLLREKGYDVIGCYFDVLGNSYEETEYAKKLAGQLGIRLITEDVSDDFNRIVIDNFCTEYLSGRTPNPCIVCNPGVKFKKLIENADKIEADYIATGHYARIKEIDGNYYIQKALNEQKDQSYMLYRLPENVIRRLIFPLGDVSDKVEVRHIAKENMLENADKRDSQEICFIGPGDNYNDYIKRRGATFERGFFVDKDGKVLGEHEGIPNYTIGQRKGLGIALGKPVFVTKIDSLANTVTLGENEELFSNEVKSTGNVFTVGKPDNYDGKEISAKIRYSAGPEKAVIHVSGDEIITTFDKPQRAVTPGQSIVFYDNDIVIGGGFMV